MIYNIKIYSSEFGTYPDFRFRVYGPAGTLQVLLRSAIRALAFHRRRAWIPKPYINPENLKAPKPQKTLNPKTLKP